MTGCLLLNKNPGITSFQSLILVKKALNTGKVCHTGTLDRFARGLLVVLTGRAVKLSSWFTGCDKKYRALVRFGEETDTLDPEGKEIATAPVPKRDELEAALPAFTGHIMQVPPLYSAIHINGKRAHELARAGIETKMKKRPVRIYSLSLLFWEPPHAELEVHCSSGTYIRSLARDIALSIGSRAHLRSLNRTMVGQFSIEEALRLSQDTASDNIPLDQIRSAILPLSPELFARLDIPVITIDKETARDIERGIDMRFLCRAIPELGSLVAAALFGPECFAALVERKNGIWKYGFINAPN